MQNSSISGVIFDCDGVLVDSTGHTINGIVEAVKDWGLSFDKNITDFLRTIWGAGYTEIISSLAQKYNWHEKPEKLKALTDFLLNKEEGPVPKVKGASAMLAELAAAKPIALVSSRRRKTGDPIMVSHGFTQMAFVCIQFREDCLHLKPDHRSLQPAITKIALHPGNQRKLSHKLPILFVGDTISHDLAAARPWFDILAFVGVCSGVNTSEEFLAAGVPKNHVIHGIDQVAVRLPEIIRSFNGRY